MPETGLVETGFIEAVHRSAGHSFSKPSVARVELIAGIGVVGDSHAGARVKHRSRVAIDPDQPNLRQVHLLPAELFDELEAYGHVVRPGELGENLTTRGVDLLGIGTGSTLRVGDDVILVVTGLRNPCGQIEAFQPGLLDRLRVRDSAGGIVRKAGVMAVVVRGGVVSDGDRVEWVAPPGKHIPLEPV